MYGQTRTAWLDRAFRTGSRLAQLARTAVHLAAGQRRWGPTDLYAALMTVRFHASHELIEQSAHLGDDDTTVVAARTWPWLGATYVYEENDQ